GNIAPRWVVRIYDDFMGGAPRGRAREPGCPLRSGDGAPRRCLSERDQGRAPSAGHLRTMAGAAREAARRAARGAAPRAARGVGIAYTGTLTALRPSPSPATMRRTARLTQTAPTQ